MAGPDAPASSFLFVNYEAAAGARTKIDSSVINSHSQRTARRLRREASLQKLKFRGFSVQHLNDDAGPLEDGPDEEKKRSRDGQSSRFAVYDWRKERTRPPSTGAKRP